MTLRKPRSRRVVPTAVSALLSAICLIACEPERELEREDLSVDGIVAGNRWHPGIYVKVEDWQLQNPSQMEAIYEELRTTPQLRGLKVTVMWGRYETRNAATGVSTYDFSELRAILDRLATMDDKHLMLSFTWREFNSDNGASQILPNDLRSGRMWNEDPTWAHMRYDYAWAYRQAHNGSVGDYGYNLSLWNTTVRSRLNAFLRALANRLDGHPNLTSIGPVESAPGEPVVPFRRDTESVDGYLAGQWEVTRMMRRHFTNAMVFASLNFPRNHIAGVVPLLEAERIGLGSPNSNLQSGLNSTGANPGVLTYYPTLSGRVALAPEIQGEDYRFSNGDNAVPDYPAYGYLYRRVRDDLRANYVVLQRTSPFWLGDSTTPSMLAFIRNNAAINADASGAGGLNRTLPSSLSGAPCCTSSDAGAPVTDGGAPVSDAGAPIIDAGATVVDAGATPSVERWHPGIYMKIEDWQLQRPSEMEAIYEELRTTPQLRGIRVTVLWGRYETRNVATGVSTFDFSQLVTILSRLAAMNDKHLILSIAWREFKSENGVTDILPNDLRAGQPWSDDPEWAHTRHQYAWAYKQSPNPGEYGYNLSLWNPTVRSRLNAFLAALGNRLDSHPNLTVVSTTESAIGAPLAPFRTGEGEAQQFAGQLAVIRMIRAHFPTALTIPDLNFSRQHVANVVAIMENEGIGLGSSNSNLASSLNTTVSPPGVLTYYPELSGRVALAPEIQGQDYRFSNPDNSVPDYPTYAYLFRRARDNLRANYVVMQRNYPFWLGNATTPSILQFIRNHPAINSDPTGAAGLDRAVPSNLLP